MIENKNQLFRMEKNPEENTEETPEVTDVYVVTMYLDGRKDHPSKLIGVFSTPEMAQDICLQEEKDDYIGEIIQIGIDELRPNPLNLPGKVIKALPTFS